MNLPTIQQHTELKQAVSARDLYNFLEPSERFASWFDRQLQYGFVENQDYLGCEVFNTLARQTLADFAVSIEMAKEISMIQRSDKGKQARQYFLECERQAQQSSQPVVQLPNFSNPVEAARAWADEVEQKQIAIEQINELAPKAEALDRISHLDGALGIRETAQAVGMKQNEFVAWCIDENKPVSRRFMYREKFSGRLKAYGHRVQQGYISQKLNYFIDKQGLDCAKPQIKFTPAGITKIAEILQKEKQAAEEVAPCTI